MELNNGTGMRYEIILEWLWCESKPDNVGSTKEGLLVSYRDVFL